MFLYKLFLSFMHLHKSNLMCFIVYLLCLCKSSLGSKDKNFHYNFLFPPDTYNQGNVVNCLRNYPALTPEFSMGFSGIFNMEKLTNQWTLNTEVWEANINFHHSMAGILKKTQLLLTQILAFIILEPSKGWFKKRRIL